MSSIPEISGSGGRVDRVPDQASESRLLSLRQEAERHGRVKDLGVRPIGAPMPKASPETGYYGIHMLKLPQWTVEIPLYFFAGGAAGACSVIAPFAEWLGNDEKLASDCRTVALAGVTVSTALLISDLGRPSRFLNMLRVFKPQSAMSMGAWTLALFGNAAGAAWFFKQVQRKFNWLPIRMAGNLSQLGALVLGLPLHNYTGVLIGATAVPVWNKSVKTLPIHFGQSGVQAGVSILELMGNENKALNLLGLASTAWETFEGYTIETCQDRELKPLKRGASGWLTRAGGVLSGPIPLALRAFSLVTGNQKARRIATYCGIAGSIFTRFAWIQAGKASARDWRLPLDIPDAAAGTAQPFPDRVPAKYRDEKIA